jgi:hypothetical protein
MLTTMSDPARKDCAVFEMPGSVSTVQVRREYSIKKITTVSNALLASSTVALALFHMSPR